MQGCLLYKWGNFTKVNNHSFFTTNRVTFLAIIFLKELARVIKGTYKFKSFSIVEVNYSSLELFEDKEMFFDGNPKYFPNFFKGYYPKVLWSVVFTNSCNSSMQAILGRWQEFLFILNRIAVCRFLYSSSSRLLWLQVSVVISWSTMKECWSSHADWFRYCINREYGIDSFIVNLNSTFNPRSKTYVTTFQKMKTSWEWFVAAMF